MKFLTIFLPEVSEAPLVLDDLASHLSSDTWRMKGGHHVLEVVTFCRNETLGFVLSVLTLKALHRQHNTLVFSVAGERLRFFTSFSMHSLVLLVIRTV